jgi:transposase
MRRIAMGNIKEILKFSASGLSRREIAAATGSSLGTVHAVISRINASGVKDPLALKEHELGAIVYPTAKAAAGTKPEPDLEFIHAEMKRPGVTLNLLWEEYKMQHPDGYGRSQFCARYFKFRKQNDVYLRKTYKAADQAMVDWAGQTMAYHDSRGNEHTVYFFVAILPATSLIYAEPFADMKLESWIQAHINAFEYFGGAPRLLIPDNLKTGVTRVNRYESDLNKTYVEMSRYYGTAILPARARKPRDKGPAENAVKIVEHNIMAPLRDRQFHSLPELRKEAMTALERVNDMPFQKMPGSRRALFEKNERSSLRPLPASPYEFAAFKLAKPSLDYHVLYEGFYYSVPWEYAHKQVEIRATTRTIEVFCDNSRIAAHLRSYDPSRRYTTCFQHMPKNHQAMADWTPQRFKNWAAKIGPHTEAYILWLMEQRDQPEQAFRTCAAILHLADTAAPGAMEEAAGNALQMRCYGYKSFSLMLKRIGMETPEPIKHENIRGAGYYGGHTHA